MKEEIRTSLLKPILASKKTLFQTVSFFHTSLLARRFALSLLPFFPSPLFLLPPCLILISSPFCCSPKDKDQLGKRKENEALQRDLQKKKKKEERSGALNVESVAP